MRDENTKAEPGGKESRPSPGFPRNNREVQQQSQPKLPADQADQDNQSNQDNQSQPVDQNQPALTELQQALGEKYGSRLDATQFSVSDAVGGWRGILEAVGPTVVFVISFVWGLPVWQGAILALAFSTVMIVWRLMQKQSLRQAIAGSGGVIIGVIWASWSGKGEDFFAFGLWTNTIYLAVFALSVLLRVPILGLVMGLFRNQGLQWRKDPRLRADRGAYYAVTILWMIMFAVRLAVKVPLYYASEVTWLATFQVLLGVPLFALVAWLSWLILGRGQGSFLSSGIREE